MCNSLYTCAVTVRIKRHLPAHEHATAEREMLDSRAKESDGSNGMGKRGTVAVDNRLLRWGACARPRPPESRLVNAPAQAVLRPATTSFLRGSFRRPNLLQSHQQLKMAGFFDMGCFHPGEHARTRAHAATAPSQMETIRNHTRT